MDELSPSGIDNHHAVFHLADGIVVDEVFGLFGKGAVQGNDVRAMVQFVQCGIYHLMFPGEIVVGIEVVGKDVHAETAQNGNELFGNLSRSDDTCCLAVHVESQKPMQREVPVARTPSGAGYFPVEGKHEGNCVFGHRIGGVGGHAYYGDAVFGGCFQVYVVISGAAQGKQFHAVCRHLPDDFRVGRIVHEDAHCIHALRQYDVVQVEMPFIITEFKTVFTVFFIE